MWLEKNASNKLLTSQQPELKNILSSSYDNEPIVIEYIISSIIVTGIML